MCQTSLGSFPGHYTKQVARFANKTNRFHTKRNSKFNIIRSKRRINSMRELLTTIK